MLMKLIDDLYCQKLRWEPHSYEKQTKFKIFYLILSLYWHDFQERDNVIPNIPRKNLGITYKLLFYNGQESYMLYHSLVW